MSKNLENTAMAGQMCGLTMSTHIREATIYMKHITMHTHYYAYMHSFINLPSGLINLMLTDNIVAYMLYIPLHDKSCRLFIIIKGWLDGGTG